MTLLQEPTIIGLQPDRMNIKYIIKECPSVKDLCHQLGDELKSKRLLAPKAVLFWCLLQHCASIFASVKRCLGKNITEPPGCPPYYNKCFNFSVYLSLSQQIN